MLKIIIYLKEFFNPTTTNYQLQVAKETIISKIQDLNKPYDFFTNADLRGSFITEDTFKLNLVSAVYNKGVIKFNSTLVGTIIEPKPDQVQINVTLKPNISFYLFFCITVLFGTVYFYKCFTDHYPVSHLLGALTMLIGGPFFLIAFSNITNAAILERFETIIKPFR